MLGAVRAARALVQRAASHGLPLYACSALRSSAPCVSAGWGALNPIVLDLAAARPFCSAATAATDAASLPGTPDRGGLTPRGKFHHNVVFYPHVTEYFKDATVPVFNLSREVVGSHTLPGAIFGLPVRVDILHRVIRWQRAKRQQGTHKAKDRSEVRGGGRKPRPQKGSGRSRQGSIRAPQWRGGGISHGPIPRSHAHDLPKKLRRLGLKCALSAKAHERRLIVVDSLAPPEARTRVVRQHLDLLLADAPRLSVLLVDAAVGSAVDGGQDLRLATRNIPGVEVVPAIGANVYSLLKRDFVIMTRAAVDLVVQRLVAPINRLGASGRARAGASPGSSGGVAAGSSANAAAGPV